MAGRRPGRPVSGRPRREIVTTSQPAALMAWLRGYAKLEGVDMSRCIERGLLLFRAEVEVRAIARRDMGSKT